MMRHTLALAASWWILAEGHPSIGYGIAVVAAARLAIAVVSPRDAPRWCLRGLPRFVAVFVSGSVRGGLDVARRALAPRMPIAPRILTYTVRLPEGAARNLFLGVLTLMPGSLGVDAAGASVGVHVLADHHRVLASELATLERCIARLARVPLEATHA